MIVGGAGAIGASAFTSVVGVVALGLSAELGAPSPAAGAVLGLGLVGAAGGTALLVFGVRRRSAYRGWMREQGIVKGKPAGHGLLVGGPMTMVGGVTLLAVGGGDVTASILGGVTLAGGIGMTTAGALRKRKYEAWAKRFELASVVPSVVPIERGAVLGWSGRF